MGDQKQRIRDNFWRTTHREKIIVKNFPFYFLNFLWLGGVPIFMVYIAPPQQPGRLRLDDVQDEAIRIRQRSPVQKCCELNIKRLG